MNTLEPDFTKLPVFSLKERDRRWKLANDLMENNNLDCLIVYGDREGSFPAPFSPDTYLTNDRPGSIVIFPKNGEPIALVIIVTVIEDHIQAKRYNKHQGWLKPENMYVGKMGSMVVQVLEDRGLDKCNIGVVGLEAYPPFYFDGTMPYNTWDSIKDGLPHATFTSVGREFMDMTFVKSEEELEVYKWSANIGEQMCQAMLDTARAGVRESEVYSAAVATSAKYAGITSVLLMGSGPEYVGWGAPAWTYRPEEPRILEEGDILLSEVFSGFGMLESQCQPAIAIGKIHPDFEVAAKIARKSYENGVAMLRDGVTFGEVVEAMNEPMNTIECGQVHPLVHSISPFGLIGAGNNRIHLEEFENYGQVLDIPSIGADMVLREGMVFALEPNCAIGSKVINLGGTVVVGKEKGIELNTLSTHLMRV